jgi:DNA repair exonuclease SbcCD nuclease subunit
MKIVLTADNHLNYYSQKLGTKLAERRKYFGEAWEKTIEFAIKNKVDLYLCAGDLFDQVMPRNPPRARVVEGFVNLKKNGIRAYVIGGHHDTHATSGEGATPHNVLARAGLAAVFEGVDKFDSDLVEIDGIKVCIAGMSTDRRLRPGMDPLEGLEVPAKGDFNIAMLHYSVERFAPQSEAEPFIRISSIERNKDINLFAMGHYHKHKKIPIGDSLVLFPGATEHNDFGEFENKTGFWFIEVEDGEINTEYIETAPQPMKQVHVFTSDLPRDNVMGKLLGEIKKTSDPNGLLQLVMEGDLEFEAYSKIDFLKLLRVGEEHNFYFEYDDRISPTLEGFEVGPVELLDPRVELIKLGEKFAGKVEGEEKRLWERALELAIGAYDKASMEVEK